MAKLSNSTSSYFVERAIVKTSRINADIFLRSVSLLFSETSDERANEVKTIYFLDNKSITIIAKNRREVSEN